MGVEEALWMESICHLSFLCVLVSVLLLGVEEGHGVVWGCPGSSCFRHCRWPPGKLELPLMSTAERAASHQSCPGFERNDRKAVTASELQGVEGWGIKESQRWCFWDPDPYSGCISDMGRRRGVKNLPSGRNPVDVLALPFRGMANRSHFSTLLGFESNVP